VEMCARVALPGSPVLVCRSPAAGHSHDRFNCRVGLLGISCGYIFDEGGMNTGLNRVMPAWRISELLDAPALQADRCGEPPARAACTCTACAESPYSDPGVGNTAAARDAILRSMLATPPVARKSRSVR
jgi:hypothetical protein